MCKNNDYFYRVIKTRNIMKAQTTVFYPPNLDAIGRINFVMKGDYSPYCAGSYVYNEGGAPEASASFEVHSIKINDVEMIDNLTESFIDELVYLALINLK